MQHMVKAHSVRVGMMWLMVAWGIVLAPRAGIGAEIYLWTDEQGVVHMTDQWANVPEAMRAQVSVREGSVASSQGTPSAEPVTPPLEPPPVEQPPLAMAPDLSETTPSDTPAPSLTPYAHDTSVLIPHHRPLVHRHKKVSPPFPYNVRLDPFDKNFVWVGPNRVPKDTFTYPRVSLDKQAQFRNRVRALEQRRSAPQKTSPTAPRRP
jgi:hypothetical protein